jgi:Fic family protein
MTSREIRRYALPNRWILYNPAGIFDQLVEAKAAAGILNQMPYLSQWIKEVHEEQLRLEAAGTSRIEGAEFSQREEDEALAPQSAMRTDLTRSQRQLQAADATYRWLRLQPSDRVVNAEFIMEVHRHLVTGCDDDHCEPGALRAAGWNVNFGAPLCRGADGGEECRSTFGALCEAIAGEFLQHDGIIQAAAAHYHIGAMHPFGDGNGRTARALEAFMVRRAGVSTLVMVSLSNYYHEHKEEYLAALSESRRLGHDLTPFLRFALIAIASRCKAVAEQIAVNHKRVLYRQFAASLFGQLRSPRRRVLAFRQLQILEHLLDVEPADLLDLLARTEANYGELKFAGRAQIRDLLGLLNLNAITLDGRHVAVNLDWPQQFSESELLDRYLSFNAAASASHPAMAELSQLLNRRP